MQQIIICQDCPYFKQINKMYKPYCNYTKKRCEELNQFKGYTQLYNELLNKLGVNHAAN